jgi:glycosyltransferase involved in cell wall biosynthesis
MTSDRAGRKIRVLHVVAMQVRWLCFEWLCEELDRERFELSFLLVTAGEPALAAFLGERGIPFRHLRYRGMRSLPAIIAAVARHCRRHRIDVVHTHFFPGCMAGLIGALLAGVPVRVYTRHSVANHGFFPRRVAYDRLFNALATAIVAPDRMVQTVLVEWEKVAPAKVRVIHHGFDLERFRRPPAAAVQALAAKYGIAGAWPVVGVVARYVEHKGVHYIVPAFAEVRRRYPGAKLVLANARGDYSPIAAQLAALPPGSYVEIPFEDEIAALYPLFDVFVHTPVDPWAEGFGQVYVEALAAGVPSLVTPSGVAGELLEHGRNAWVVGFRSSPEILAGLLHLLAEPELRAALGSAGQASVAPAFALAPMMRSLEALYGSLCEAAGP